jgi:hypothetical protein
MGLLRYSEHDLRALLSRVIHVRWPSEELMILTRCHKVSSETANLSPDLERPEVRVVRGESRSGSEHGFLAATQSRLIFQEEVTSALLLRTISLVIAAMAVAILFLGDGLGSFLPVAAASLGLWGLAKILEMLLAARTDIHYDWVGNLDPVSQRIEGMTKTGMRCHLGVPDSLDFDLVVALVEGRAAA